MSHGLQVTLTLMMQNSLKLFWPIVRRSISGRCPNCGKGELFSSYLKPVQQCAVCGEPLGHIRADDGPAWLTILLVGHILATFLLIILPKIDWPDWMITTVIMILTLILGFAILPRAKGFFIGMIWCSGCIGSEK